MASPDPPDAPVRVLTVDDQPTFHDAAHAVIAATPGFEWIGSASCGEEGVEQTERLLPDLVLMDVRMPGIGGFEAARRISGLGLPAVVVLVTGDLPPASTAGAPAGVVAKRSLTRSVLKRLWAERR